MLTEYRLQEREFSTDIVEYSQDKGKNWKPLMMVFLPKKVGDMLIEDLMEYLNQAKIGFDLNESILTEH